MRRRDFFQSLIGAGILPPVVRTAAVPQGGSPNMLRGQHSVVARPKRAEQKLRCSFCGKPQTEVRKIIAGPASFICNECVEVCNVIMTDDLS